jgi:hypothetical protein
LLVFFLGGVGAGRGWGGLLKLLPKSARKLFVSVFATVIVVESACVFWGCACYFCRKELS